MSSNKIRTSFGITDKRGKKFSDIISCFLSTRIITCTDFDSGFIIQNMQRYYLHCDRQIRTELGNYNYAKVLISYQHRTTGFFAIARLYKEPCEATTFQPPRASIKC